MSTAGTHDMTPVTSKADLVAWLEKGCKPKGRWRIGTEHEKFGFRKADLKPLPYEAAAGEPSVRAMFDGLMRFGWEPILEGDKPLAMRRGEATIALEPGGQFELSGAPLFSLHDTCMETNTHLSEVREVADELGAGFLGLGFTPDWSFDDIPAMPKARYGIMKRYMSRVGRMGHNMMFRTCTVQANFDFASEADMVRKLRAAVALQPVATALFANSPFGEGKPSGFLSLRAFVWTDTDNDRTGMVPFVFEQGFGFERWVDYALDTPMYFLRRNGVFNDVAGQSFRDLMAGKLSGFEGEIATLGDFEDHLSTLFPEARIKRILEVRGADGGPWGRLCALPAFWTGLLYSEAAIDAALEMTARFSAQEREMMRMGATKFGLDAPIGNTTLGEMARAILPVIAEGLKDRASLNQNGQDERAFLGTLEEIAETGITPAQSLLERFHGAWEGDIKRAYVEEAY
jgi:glutamate--cysteine ligase